MVPDRSCMIILQSDSMNIFQRFFRGTKDQNPYYIKLNKTLLRSGEKIKVNKAYFLLGLPDSFENRRDLKDAIARDTLKKLKDLKAYDVAVNNLELYFIEDASKCYLVVLLDPYELYESEQILEVIPVGGKNFDFDPELIYEQH
jgi:hypothetical protein